MSSDGPARRGWPVPEWGPVVRRDWIHGSYFEVCSDRDSFRIFHGAHDCWPVERFWHQWTLRRMEPPDGPIAEQEPLQSEVPCGSPIARPLNVDSSCPLRPSRPGSGETAGTSDCRGSCSAIGPSGGSMRRSVHWCQPFHKASNHEPHEKYGTSLDHWHTSKYDP